MNELKVKIKKEHPDAVIPSYAKIGDAGMDMTAVSVITIKTGTLWYDTGLSFEIPDGYVGCYCFAVVQFAKKIYY
jgi:dUTP pyrophosphatase